MQRATVAIGIASALAVALGAPADAGGSGRIKAKTAKQEDGPYSANLITHNLEPGHTKVFYAKVKNNTPDQPFDVNMGEVAPDTVNYKQKYFRNGYDISDAVKSTGFVFHLEPQRTKRFKLKVKAVGGTDPPFCSRTRYEEVGVGPGLGYSLIGLNGSGCD